MASEKQNGDTLENEPKEEGMETKTTPEVQNESKEGTDVKDGKDDEEAKEEEEEEEEESSDEEELPLGSVEAPVQIMTGKRDRKKVERLVMQETPKTPEKKFVVPAGKGVKLGDIGIIAYRLDRTKSQDLKPLHKFLFGKSVKDQRETKKNIRLFSGFNFDSSDEEYTKREAILVKFTVEGMKELCTILDVEKKGTKDKIMERIMEFCLNPQPSDKPIPEKGKRGRASQKKKSKPKKKGDSAKKKKKAVAGGDASTVSEDGDTTMEDGTEGDADGEGEDGETSVTEGESKPKKKKAKATPKPKKEKPKAKSPKKKKIAVKTPTKQTKKEGSPAKSSKKTPQKRKQDEVEDDSSDDEPLVKKTKKPPTDKEIRKTVQDILEGANLEEVTMKMVCRKVYDTYPDFPLQHKKDFIKSTVRDIIS